MTRVILTAVLITAFAGTSGAGTAIDSLNGGASPAQLAVSAPAFSAGMQVLPDDTIREELPTGPEIIPAFPLRKPAGGEKQAVELDPRGLVPADLKAAALAYLASNSATIPNQNYLGVIDFSRHSSLARFFIIDMRTGAVRAFHVAHGSGSDPDKDGFATVFSNTVNSNASSLGFYMTGVIYYGRHGRSMRLHGLSETNSNAFERAVVVHSADYVSDSDVQPGRSWGCPAVSEASLPAVIDMLKEGAVIYAGLSGSAQ